MPTSEHWQIPHVLDVIASERPATLLDVGAGFGKYGCLAREYAETRRVDALDVQAPKLPCEECGAAMELGDFPERYLSIFRG